MTGRGPKAIAGPYRPAPGSAPPLKSLRFVVTGMHRSGTTWLGRLLGGLPSVFLMNEPFNARTGLKGVPRWYLDPRLESDLAYLDRSLEAIAAGTARFSRFIGLETPPTRLITAALRGTGQERAYRGFLASEQTDFFVKDPFLLLVAPHLLDRGMPVVVTVRHPAAILQSLRRMHWKIPTDLFRDRVSAADRARLDGDDIAAICACWRAAYRPLLDRLRAGGTETLFIAAHELMFDDVEGFLVDLLEFLELSDPADLAAGRAFAARTTTATTIRPEHGQKHDLARDSRALASGWRKDFDAAELATFDAMIGEDYDDLLRFADRPRAA